MYNGIYLVKRLGLLVSNQILIKKKYLISYFILRLKIEYACKSGCDSCDQQKECICQGGKKILNDGTCGDCLINKGFYIEQDKCKTCFTGCSSCLSSEQNACNSCLDGYILQNNQCIKCDINCETCSGSKDTDCKSCLKKNEYIDEDSKRCKICETQNGYYISGNQCLKCSKGCQTCKGSLQTQCLSCKKQHYAIYKKI